MRRSLATVWRTDLPRPVLLLQAGNAFSWFGYGLILPFEIIYLHEFRGFSTALAGLVLGAILGAGTLATPPAGVLLDRFRAKPVLIAANLASALGFAGLAFVDRPWQAFACAVVGGAGVGVTRTAQQTLLILLVTPEQRADSYALGRVAQNLGIGLGAMVAGLVISASPYMRSFQALYLLDAITYAALALVVLVVLPNPRGATASGGPDGGFRQVVRDRTFMLLIAANFVLLVVVYAQFLNILSPYVRGHTSAGAGAIGFLFLLNSAVVVIAQLPLVRVFKRLRRAQVYGATCAVFAVGLFGVLLVPLIHSGLAAGALLCAVGVVIGIGECTHAVVLGPLAPDLAPPHLLGRYISVFTLMITGGFAVGPAIGGVVFAYAPNAVWWGGGFVAAAIGAGFLLAGDRVPDKPRAETEPLPPSASPMPEPA
jgi:MFS family permease